MRRRTDRLAVALALALWVYTAAPAAAQFCAGDCDADATTAPGEIAFTIALLFDSARLGECEPADADGGGGVTAADLVAAMAARLGLADGCEFAPPRSIWTTLAGMPGGGRQEVAAAALGEAIYVVGGFDENGRGSALVERYDIASDSWTRVADLPAAVNHAGAAALDGAVYVVGGFAGTSFQPTAAVTRYDPVADEWADVAPLPAPRGALAVVALNGRLHALGGNAPASVTTHTAYDPVADEWVELAPFPGPGRNHLAAVELGGAIYVVGGRVDGSGLNNSDALDRYDPDTDSWTPLAPLPTARSGIGAGVWRGRIVVLGGEVSRTDPNGVFPHVELYDPATDRWTRLDDMPVPRHGIWTVSVADRLYIPGGAIRAAFGATAHHDVLALGL